MVEIYLVDITIDLTHLTYYMLNVIKSIKFVKNI